MSMEGFAKSKKKKTLRAEPKVEERIEERVEAAVDVCQTCGIRVQAEDQVILWTRKVYNTYEPQGVDGFDNMKWQPTNGKHNDERDDYL